MDPRIRRFYRLFGIVHDIANPTGMTEQQQHRQIIEEDDNDEEKVAVTADDQDDDGDDDDDGDGDGDGDGDKTGNDVERECLSVHARVSFQRHARPAKRMKTYLLLHSCLGPLFLLRQMKSRLVGCRSFCCMVLKEIPVLEFLISSMKDSCSRSIPFCRSDESSPSSSSTAESHDTCIVFGGQPRRHQQQSSAAVRPTRFGSRRRDRRRTFRPNRVTPL